MNLETLIESLPDYARDMKLNYSTHVRQQTELTPSQIWGTVLASAMATRNEVLIAAAAEQVKDILKPQETEAVKIAATIMGMNNVYYRFHHLSSNEKYGTMRSQLRMNAMRGHGAEEIDFELWCLAVSAINACDKCVDSHEKVLRSKEVSEEKVLAAVRIASILHALANVVAMEHATSETGDLSPAQSPERSARTKARPRPCQFFCSPRG